MERTEIESLVGRLAAAPGRIATATSGLTPEQLATPPTDNEWSALGVMAHMRACDDILSPRLIAMMVRDEPSMPLFDDRCWAEVMGYADGDFQELLAAYSFKRAELVRALRRLDVADWQRSGLLETRGPIRMLDVLRMIVEHEEEHCRQFETLLKTR